jgi:hypothetical protein
MESLDSRAFCVQHDTTQQVGRERRVPATVEGYFVLFIDFVSRVHQPLRQIAIVRQNQQTFALGVEPADIEEAAELWRKQVENGVACVRVASRGDEAGRLVQHDVKMLLRPNKLAAHFDVIAFRRLRTEIGARPAVDGHFTGRDQFVALSPRTDTGSGEKPVQTHDRL